MYLVDTNTWLERLLGQAKPDEVDQFLDQTPTNELFIADFAFHSIGVILTRLKRKEALVDFVQAVFINGASHQLCWTEPAIQDLLKYSATELRRHNVGQQVHADQGHQFESLIICQEGITTRADRCREMDRVRELEFYSWPE